MGLKNSWAHVCVHVLNVMIHPSQRGLPPHSHNNSAFCQCHGNPLASTSRKQFPQRRNPNVASRCWWASDCDCLQSCRGALRWRRRALHAPEGAAAVNAGANRPEISTQVQELVFESSPVTVRLVTSNRCVGWPLRRSCFSTLARNVPAAAQ